MKKMMLAGLLALAVINPMGIAAQKKDKKSKKDKKEERIVKDDVLSVKTHADTLSYAFGASIVEGLPQYLTQMNVLTDTAAIRAEYTAKIQNESNASTVGLLKSEMQQKLDSANMTNKANLDKFIQGFQAAFMSSDKAYNAGVSISAQLDGMTEKFSEEVLGEKDALNRKVFAAAFTDAITKEKPLLIENSRELMEQASMQAQENKEKAEQEKLKGQYQEQIQEGEKFLAENKNKPGVVTRPSGLQYKVVTEGNGPIPKANDEVRVHYHGTLLDGTVFDSSVERGEPIEFRVGQLIRGWNEALMLMPKGSKWILYVPYDLAYGSRDMGTIKPFSTLIFEVELLDIIEPATQE